MNFTRQMCRVNEPLPRVSSMIASM